MIILKITKKQGFTLSLEDTFLEKPQEGSNVPLPPAFLGLKHCGSLIASSTPNLFSLTCQSCISESSYISESSISFNPIHVTDLFLYPLTTSENIWFSDIFRGHRKRSVAWNGLSSFNKVIIGNPPCNADECFYINSVAH